MKPSSLPRAPIQIQRDNLFLEVEQLKAALIQKDNMINSHTSTISSLQNQLAVQTNLVAKNNLELTDSKDILNAKTLECSALNEKLTNKNFLLAKAQEELSTLTAQKNLELHNKDQLIVQKEKELKTLQDNVNAEKEKLLEARSLVSTLQQQLNLKSSEQTSLSQTLAAREEEIKKQAQELETLTWQLVEQKNLNQQNETLISALTEKVETLNSSLEQSKNQFLHQTIAIKELEESGYKKELLIKDMENKLLKKDLIVQELENKLAISEIKTAPTINSELLFLKEQLADKNLIIELLKSKKAPVFEISDSKILESLDLDNIGHQPITNTNPKTNPLLQFENMHITTSVLLSGDVSLIDEEDSI